MTYTVEYTEKAIKSLKKLDPPVRKMIRAWIEKNLLNCEDPRAYGKGLTANRSGQWRYRVGDYRILADIQENRLVIVVVEIGHRKAIYD